MREQGLLTLTAQLTQADSSGSKLHGLPLIPSVLVSVGDAEVCWNRHTKDKWAYRETT
jgi:hypothetical protein